MLSTIQKITETAVGEHLQVKNPASGFFIDPKSSPFGVPDSYTRPIVHQFSERNVHMLPKPTLEIIETASIIDPKSADRTIDPKHVAHLADSLTEISQMKPIVVKRQSVAQYVLHDGAHRLHAAIKNGVTTIQAQVFDENTPDEHIRRSILECEFITREVPWSVKCLKLQELKSNYAVCYPQTVPGKWKRGDKSADAAVPSFVSHIMKQSGDKRSTISEMLTLAKGLGAPLLHLLDQHTLSKDVGKDLLKQPVEERLPIVEKLVVMKREKSSGRHTNLTVASARDKIKRDARESASESIELTDDDVTIKHSLMQNYTGSLPNSVDAIITDPLYHEKHLDLYEKAAEMSARVLKPGGFAAFYCGRLYLEKILGFLGAHLRLRTFITLHHKEHFGNVGNSKLSNDSKTIFIYQKVGADVDFFTSVPGVIEGTGQEKGFHEFQQSVSDLDTLIDAISRPGETILDMFAGSGTTGVAAVQKGRRTILIEKEKVHYNTCNARLKDALARRNKRPIPFHIPSISSFISIDSTAAHLDDVSDEDSGDLRTAM